MLLQKCPKLFLTRSNAKWDILKRGIMAQIRQLGDKIANKTWESGEHEVINTS